MRTRNFFWPGGLALLKQAWVLKVCLLVLSAGMIAQPVIAQINAPKINVDNTPSYNKPDPFLYVKPIPSGHPAPDIQVMSADNKKLSLQQFRNKKYLVIVFYQGHFCPVCGQQLSNLQKHYSDFQAQGAEIIAISADDMTHAQMTLGEKGLAFQIVPDPQKSIIKAYGIANESKKQIAWPSVFIIDKKGIVRFSYAVFSGHRLHSGDILPELSKLTGKPSPKLGYDE